ncbi:MAG: DUF2336 domain-containing protein [Parvibaculaceae bacterium]|nr:DUF2336 domain-containing protein [Parvibaculaceae bacterium]
MENSEVPENLAVTGNVETDERSQLDPSAPVAQEWNELLRPLVDLLMLSGSTLNLRERELLDMLLARVVDRMSPSLRTRLGERLQEMTEPPQTLLLEFARADDEVGHDMLRYSPALSQAELINITRSGSEPQRRIIIRREHISEELSDALVETALPANIHTLLASSGAHFSARAIRTLIDSSEGDAVMQKHLLGRTEFGLRDASRMFWLSPKDTRRRLLLNYSVERTQIQGLLGDNLETAYRSISSMGDPVFTELVHMLTSRKKIRPEMAAHLMDLLKQGHWDAFLEKFAEDAEIRSQTMYQMANDAGGEALAVLCKAINFPRAQIELLTHMMAEYRSLKQSGANDPELISYNIALFDELATEKADMILSSWDLAVRHSNAFIAMNVI